MRKYQQLLLLIISGISVGVLFMYKTENKRLKDVLHVINFFGRNDAAILKKIDNATSNYLVDYSYPVAVWQSIGERYNAYSAFWRRNELVAGGEVIVAVVGQKHAILNFKCALNFKGNSNRIQGKFRFQKMDKDGDDDNIDFTRYNFYCRTSRDFGTPESVVLYDLTSKSKNGHYLKLRHIKVMDEDSKKLSAEPLTVCVDLTGRISQNVESNERQDSELLQFFIHHSVVGVENFIIYNGDGIPRNVLQLLHRMNLRLHLLPFNFPFPAQNSTERMRSIIEADCLLRSTNRARYCLLLAPNEFLYPNSKLSDRKSLIHELNHYSNSITHFELAAFAVCKSENFKYIFDNTLYDSEIKPAHIISIYKPLDTTLSSSEDLLKTSSRTTLPLSKVFAHRYISCVHVGHDGLRDWRNSLREDFMQFVRRLNEETKLLLPISSF